MSLTHDEMTAIDNILTRTEKNARAWRFTRWLAVGGGLLLVGQGIWLFIAAMEHFRSAMGGETGSEANVLDGMLFSQGYTNAFVLFCGGALLAASAWAHWRKGERDCLLVKMARIWLESQQAVPSSDPGARNA
jgi:hypothetical protein